MFTESAGKLQAKNITGVAACRMQSQQPHHFLVPELINAQLAVFSHSKQTFQTFPDWCQKPQKTTEKKTERGRDLSCRRYFEIHAL